MASLHVKQALVLLAVLLVSRPAFSQKQAQQVLRPEDVKRLTEELELRQYAAKDGVVSMDSEEFRQFAFLPDRTYHLALCFVAKQLWDHPRTQLREIRKEFGYAAEAFKRGSNPKDLVFVEINLDKAQEVFQLLGVESLPFIVHWAPSITTAQLSKSGGKNLVPDSDKFGARVQQYPYPAEAMVTFFRQFVDSEPAAVDRPSFKKSPLFPIVMLAGIASVGLAAYKIITSPFARSPVVWTAGSLTIYWFAVSGGLFNIIRSTPLVGRHQDGRPKYFVEGRSYQFGAEGFIMGALYVFFSMTVVGLIYAAPLIGNKRARGAVSMGLVALAVVSMRKIFELYTWKAGYQPTLFF